MEKEMLAQMIDQTLLSPVATEDEVRKFIEEAKKYEFKSVCVNPCFVKMASDILKGSRTKVCTVIDFPLGAGTVEDKINQSDVAVDHGANELDFVVNLSLVKAHAWKQLEQDLRFISRSVQESSMFSENAMTGNGAVVTKLILETCYLTDEEIVETCKCAKSAGFDFVKTSTGFASVKPNGATVHAVELMRKTVGDEMGVKASGGIHNYEEAMAMINAGASRIGASSGIQIIS